MSNEYFGGAPTAVQGGYAYGAEQRLRKQRENALNALIERFGPEAAEPAAYGQLQGIDQREQLFPHQLGAAERQTAGAQANVAAYGPAAGDPTAQGIQQTEQSTQQAERQRAALMAANYLDSTIRRGGDAGVAFDHISNALPSLGVPAEQLPQIREQFLADPQAMIEMFRRGAGEGRPIGSPIPVYDAEGRPRLMRNDGTDTLIDGVAPASTLLAEGRLGQGAERLGQGWSRLSLDEAKMWHPAAQPGVEYYLSPDNRIMADVVGGSPQERERTTETREFESNLRQDDQGDLTYTRNAEVFNRRAETIDVSVTQALEYFNSAQSGVISQLLRSGARLVPGTPAYKARAALDAVKNNLAMDELDAMRQSSVNGSSGFGQLTERELSLLMNSRGILETEHDPKTLVATLQRIQSQVTSMREIVQADVTAAAQRRTQRREQYGPDLRAPFAPNQGNRGVRPETDEYLRSQGL